MSLVLQVTVNEVTGGAPEKAFPSGQIHPELMRKFRITDVIRKWKGNLIPHVRISIAHFALLQQKYSNKEFNPVDFIFSRLIKPKLGHVCDWCVEWMVI
jgi:hypothetical protein